MKLEKPVALYMGPELLDRAGSTPHGACCGKCMMFLADTSECSILKPPQVSGPKGVCGLFVGGKPSNSKDHPPMKLVPKEVAGYIEGGGVPTHCGNCEYFLAADRACRKVEGSIDPNGCCNAWEFQGKSRGNTAGVRESVIHRAVEHVRV